MKSDPRWIRASVFALWALFSIGLGAIYVRLPPSPDQAVFDYIGWVASQGGHLYTDVAEQNWPGIMWFHELAVRAFGNQLWSFRLFDYLALLAGCGGLFALTRSSGLRLAPLLVVPLYQAMYVTSGSWFAGQRDIVAAHILLWAGVVWCRRAAGGSRGLLVLAGTLLAAASLIRPTYLAFGPALGGVTLLLVPGARKRAVATVLDTGLVTAAAVLGLAATGVGGWLAGSLTEWYDLTFRFNIEAYVRRESYGEVTARFLEFARGWHWYLAFAVVGAAVWWRKERTGLAVLAALALTSLISAYVMRQGFGYHLGGLLPVLAPLVAIAIAEGVENWSSRPTLLRTAVAVGLITITVAGLTKKTWGSLRGQIEWNLGRISTEEMLSRQGSGTPGFSMADAVAAAEFVRRTVPEDATVLTWGRPVYVNFLSERRSPTRFITVGLLDGSQQPPPLVQGWTAEFSHAIEATPPELVLVPGNGARAENRGFWESEEPTPPVRLLRGLLNESYRFERSFGSMAVYRHIDRERPLLDRAENPMSQPKVAAAPSSRAILEAGGGQPAKRPAAGLESTSASLHHR